MDSALGAAVVMRAGSLDTAARRALAAAADWRLLGLLMERPRAGWHDQVDSLARGTRSQTLRASARVARDAREGGYLALLGPGGAVSPREITYRPLEDPGRVLAEIGAFYEAFVYRPLAEDPIDHIAVEAGFVGYLHLKEAFAVSRGDAEAASIAREGATRFLEEHVRYWAAPIAKRLARAGAPHLLLATREALRRAGPPPALRGPWAQRHERSPADECSCGGGECGQLNDWSCEGEPSS
jgi:hypothetical protein